MSSQSSVRVIEDRDLDEAAALLAHAFGANREAFLLQFAHWWDDNPAQGVHPRGWIAETDGRVAAFLANIAFRYRAGEVGLDCLAAAGFAVAHQFRGQGLAKALGLQFLAQDVPMLVGAESTQAAARVWLGLGMTTLDRPWPDASFVMPALLAALSGDRRIALLSRFDSNWESDLAACRASSSPVIALRDVETLNWLYFGSPFIRQSRIVLAELSGARLAGYAAFKRRANTLYLLECRTKDCDIEVARRLLAAAQHYCWRHDLAYVRVWRYARMIDAAVPWWTRIARHSPPKPTFCYASRETNIECWENTPADGDVAVN